MEVLTTIVRALFIIFLLWFFIYMVVRLVSYAWHMSKEQVKKQSDRGGKNGVKNQKQEKPTTGSPKT
jgi:hypothetical protein